MIWIEPAKRERTKPGNYSIDQYYRDNMKTGGPTKSDKPKVIRAPKQISINDFQFYPPRLVELQQKEYDAHLVCPFVHNHTIELNEADMTSESSKLHCACTRARE